MKAILFCLLILGTGFGERTTKLSSGGVTVLTVDPQNSAISWKAEKPTGTHAGTIKIQSGSLTMYCGQLAKGTVLIDMGTMAVTDLSGSDKQKLETNLRGDNFFDIEEFPQAKLDITSVDHKSEKTYHFITVQANLTLRGITKAVTFTSNVSKSTPADFIGQADIVVNRRDYGVATKNSKYDTFIYKDIHLHVTLQANKASNQVSSL